MVLLTADLEGDYTFEKKIINKLNRKETKVNYVQT